MICPKCGQEYSGSRCPKCSEPDIVVNNDYLERRKAYEQMQAKKSEGSRKDDEELKDDDLVSELFAKVKTATVKKNGVKRTKDNNKSVNDNKNVNIRTKSIKDNRYFSLILNNKFKLIAAAGILVAAIILIIVVVNIFAGNRDKLYMAFDGGIYQVEGNDEKFICNSDTVIYKADGKGFTECNTPQEILSQDILQSISSNSGKFYGYVTYKQEDKKYTLFVADKDGNVASIVSDEYDKKIMYIDDNGTVIYTESKMINQQWAVENTELFVYKISQDKNSTITGTFSLVDNSLRSVSFYVDENTLICHNNNNELYKYNVKTGEKDSIADEVGTCYYLNSDMKYMYTENTENAVEYKEASSFIYSIGNKYIYLDISDGSELVLGKISGSGLSFAYDKDNGYLYAVGSTGVSYSKIDKDTTITFENVDTVNTRVNCIYMDTNSKLVYVNSDGNLKAIYKGALSVISENIDVSTVTEIDGINGISYVSEQRLYYYSDMQSSPVIISDNYSREYPSIVYYKSKIYYYNSDSVVNSVKQDGSDIQTIRNADRIWIG